MDIRGLFGCFVQSLTHVHRLYGDSLTVCSAYSGCHSYGPFVHILTIRGRTKMRTKKVPQF